MGRLVAFLVLPGLLGSSGKPASREYGKVAESVAVLASGDLRGSEVGASPGWSAVRLSKGLISLQPQGPLAVSLLAL